METLNKYSGIMISIRKIVRAINLESKRIEKDYSLSIPQLLTLKLLEEKTEYKSSMKELKEHLSLNASTVSGIVARLESKGLIARLPNPSDKRSTPIVLTSNGNKLIKQTDESLHERVMRKSNSLTEEEYQQILVSFQNIIEIFDIENIDASPIISGQTDI